MQIRDARVITSYSRIDAINNHMFTGPDGDTVELDAIINKSKADDSFKRIQIKGWV